MLNSIIMVNLFVFLFCAILAVLLVKGVELKSITVIDKDTCIIIKSIQIVFWLLDFIKWHIDLDSL